jgi:thiol-disulfide isomerase/thioredoxin
MVKLVKLSPGGMILVGLIVAVLVYIYFAYNISGFASEGFAQEGVVEPPQLTPVGTFTMYYADWCGHCKTAKPAFEELVKQSPIIVGGRAVNIRLVSPENEASKVDAGAKIDGFPTFYFKNDKSGELVQYNGAREVDGYKAFLEKQVKNA